MNYAFIGLGNMAGAILRGARQSGRFEGDIFWGYDALPQQALSLQQQIGLYPAATAAEAVRAAETVVLCVKPQVMASVLDEIAPALSPDKTVITIAAGLPLRFYEARLPEGQALIRAMPSINAQALAASSALCGNAFADEPRMNAAKKILGAVGGVHEVPERLFPAFSAIASAAPAFAFLFADALAQAGVRAGLTRALSQQVAAELLLGSGKLMLESGEHPRQLVDKVTSPGGTTIEGVMALDEMGFAAAVNRAVQAVIDRDRQLGEGA